MGVYSRALVVGSPGAPTGMVRMTFERIGVNSAAAHTPTSGRLQLQTIYLGAGDTVTTATFMSGSTAGATLTHTWFALYDINRALIRATADDTAATWAISTAKTLTFSTPYVVPTSGTYYLGFVVVGTTMPTLMGNSATPSTFNGLAPISFGSSNTGLVAPGTAPATATALTALTGAAWGYVS